MLVLASILNPSALTRASQLIQLAGQLRIALNSGVQNPALQRRFGPVAASALRGLEGGAHAYEVSLFRAWSEGHDVPHDDVRKALAQVIKAKPHELLAPQRKETRLFYIDPLLDLPAVRRIFPYLENSTEGGSFLELPSLDLGVYAAFGIPLKDKSDLYAALGHPDRALYLLERVLYVVHLDKRHQNARHDIEAALQAGLLSEINTLTFSTRSQPMPRTIDFEIPWQDPKALGPLNLDTVPAKVAAQWQVGKRPDLSALSDYPSLQQWFQDHYDWVHWSDIQRLTRHIDALWRVVSHHGASPGQVDALRKQILGVLGEVSARCSFIAEYRQAAAKDSQFIMLIEGEMRTVGDQRMTLDLALGRLDPDSRIFHLSQAVEISTFAGYAGHSEEQLQHSLVDRFPEKGLAIIAESGQWGRVDVESGDAQAHIVVVPTETAGSLRDIADHSMQELLAHFAIRREHSRLIPLEERRRYRAHHASSSAGRLVRWVIETLFERLDDASSTTGQHDLHWLDNQLEVRLLNPHFPESAKKYLHAFRAVLFNVSADLNRQGVKRSPRIIAGETRVSESTVRHYSAEIAQRLEQWGWKILSAPDTERKKRSADGRKAGKIFEQAWKTRDVREVAAALETALQDSTLNVAVNDKVQAYLAVLQDISADLNPRAQRSDLQAIAAKTQVRQAVMRSFRADIEQRLEQRGWKILPNPQARLAQQTVAGMRAQQISEQAWKAGDVQGVATNLAAALATPKLNKEAHGIVQTYLAVLKNISAALNSTGVRRSSSAIATETPVNHATVNKYRIDIEKRLQRRGWKILPNPLAIKAKQMSAGKRAQKIYESVWRAEDVAGVAAGLVAALANPELTKELCSMVQVYLSALENIATDLNTTGVRRSSSAIATETHVDEATVHKYRADIEQRLEQRDWAFLPDPHPKRRK